MRRVPNLSLRVPVLLIWFVVLWESLWGRFTIANLLSGLVVSIAIVILAPLPEAGLRSFGTTGVRPLRVLAFGVYFLYKVVEANVSLAWEVATPNDSIRQGILVIRLRHCSDALVTLIANAITLTPGTLTIEVRRDLGPTDDGSVASIYVHVLHLHDVDAVRADLWDLARHSVRAFGTRDALAQFDEDPAVAAGLTTAHRRGERST